MRMIVAFEKGPALRHIGHLDLMRTIQRALRRTQLPIRYSNGFNPHIQLSFAAPLSVGVVGEREVMDVPVEGACDGERFERELSAVLPRGLSVISTRPVEDTFPTLMALVRGSRIRIELDACPEADRVAQAFPLFMAGGECVTLRKTKAGENQTNIRPFIAEAALTPSPQGYTLRCLIQNRPEGSLKPAVLVQALCELAEVHAVPYIASRERILAEQNGTLLPVEEYAHG